MALPFEKTFCLRSYEVDGRGEARLVTLLNFLQDTAGDHTLQLGVALKTLLPQGLTWVLSRYHLQIRRAARFGEEVIVRTWPSAREGRFALREFEIVDAAGTPLALATSSWMLLSLPGRRPVRPAEHLPSYPILARRVIDDHFAPLPPLDQVERELPFRVRMADLDANRHVNNTVYAEWALETVPPAVVRDCRLRAIAIAFRGEAFYGDRVLSRASRTAPGPTFRHQLVTDQDERELTRVETVWEEREK